MATLIFNREEFKHPDDGWYMIEAKGEHPNQAAGTVQVIDSEACDAIVSQFNRQAADGTLRHGHEMLIDHEHFADDPDKESRAYGWLVQSQNRADGIYGKIRWTRTGQEAVDGGDYRFFSTEYRPQDVLPVRNRADASSLVYVRPIRLDGLSLTNMNNNRGQRPITNRSKASIEDVPASDGKPDAAISAVTLSNFALRDARPGESYMSVYRRTMAAHPALTQAAKGS